MPDRTFGAEGISPVISIELRSVSEGQAEICDVVLRALPLWFGIEESIQDYVREAAWLPMIAAYSGNRPVGFVSLKHHTENNLEIFVMGVLPEFHRRGTGRRLIAQAEAYAREKDIKFMTVKTVSSSRPNKEYDQTRKFYLATGFLPLEELKSLWGEDNPCLLMGKSIATN